MALVLIIAIGLIDISNIDSRFVYWAFHTEQWDLDFYGLVTIVTSVFVPISAIIITNALQADRALRFKEEILLDFISKLFTLNNFAQGLFSALQFLPIDKDKRKQFQEDRYIDFLSKYNSLVEAYGKAMLYISTKAKIVESVEDYLKTIRLLAIGWSSIYREEREGADVHKHDKDADDFCRNSGDTVKEITKQITDTLLS